MRAREESSMPEPLSLHIGKSFPLPRPPFCSDYVVEALVSRQRRATRPGNFLLHEGVAPSVMEGADAELRDEIGQTGSLPGWPGRTVSGRGGETGTCTR